MAKFMNLVRSRMGIVQTRPPQTVAPPTPVVSIACDDCGGIFTLPADFTRTERKKRCTRCAARVAEEKIAQSPYSRKCALCQMIFNVSPKIAELPSGVMVNCQRCSDTHRKLIQKGMYMEVTLQKGDDSLYICCPKHLSGELKKCMQTSKQCGYSMVAES